MAHPDDRRSFLRWATLGLGAVFGAILGVPAVLYLIDPRNKKTRPSELRLVDGVRLDDAELNQGVPKQGVIRDVRVDAWTLHPSDALGRVWVVPAPNAPRGFRVFTTICPHMGCSVNLGEGEFACPCHSARFGFDGAQIVGPALRGMDELDWEPDPTDPQRILVRYESFQAATSAKTPIH
ncbi:MAG: Rieske 2Fe-2S domain-containing protein [Gemmataceae bacterium]|nr:Rieske 2Fe-2S domain-containing protein [Gemmataceae bacterium]